MVINIIGGGGGGGGGGLPIGFVVGYVSNAACDGSRVGSAVNELKIMSRNFYWPLPMNMQL